MKFSKTAIAIASLLVSSSTLAAKYKVTELSVTPDHRQSFGVANNDVGDVLSLAREGVNYPFYFDDTFVNNSATLHSNCGISQEELDSQALDATSADCVVIQLGATSSSYFYNPIYQKIGDDKTAYFGDNWDTGIINIADVESEELSDFTRSNIEQLKEVNNASKAVGTITAPYIKQTYTVDTGDSSNTFEFFSREHDERAVVVTDGSVTIIEPSFTDYGGKSFANDISDSGFVAGYESIGIYGVFDEEIETICTGETYPANICHWSYTVQEDIYQMRAVIWQIGDDNQVISKQSYGLAFSPTETQSLNYRSQATAVNDQGIGVGYGSVPFSSTRSSASDKPLLFINGSVEEILENSNDYDRGYATDINNNNIVVGQVQTFLDSQYNDKMFVYNVDSKTFELPTIFYKGSRTTAKAINDNGLVVGNGEYEISNSDNRRKHGYVYDINTGTFNDLNDFTSCEAALEIVDAVDINNNDEIVATALKTVESIDALGNVKVDDDGNVIMVQVPVAVLLEPIADGEIESCAEEVTEYERKGFSNSLWMISFLSIFAVIRRRFL